MTVSTTTTRDQFTGDGDPANTPLPTTFAFNESSEIVVTSRVITTGVETVLTETTHYTVTGGSYETGTVTPVDGATDFPSTVEWTLERVTPLTQATDWVEGDDFPAESHERAADKLTFMAQERSDKADRALRAPTTDDAALDMELPNAVDRASLFLAFDADGEPIASEGSVPGTATVSAFGATLIDDADADAARVTLDAQEDVITTEGDIVVGDATPEAARLAIGTEGYILEAGASAPGWVENALPPAHLNGLTITHTSTTELSAAKGKARCGSSADQDLINGVNPSAFSKTFVAGWAAGDGNAGVITGALAAAAADWHYFMLVGAVSGAIDFGYDTDVDAANLIADVTVVSVLGPSCYYRRLCTFRSSATPDIPAFTQKPGGRFMLTVVPEAYSATGQDWEGAQEGTVLTLANYPGGIHSVGLFRIILDGCTAQQGVVIAPKHETADTPDINDVPLMTMSPGATDVLVAQEVAFDMDTTRQLQLSALDSTVDLHIGVRGWIDRRGQDD